jgi:predicted RNase H-like HicB family nuclease
MITVYAITVREDSERGQFTATLPDVDLDEIYGTGETLAEALHDLAEQCEEVCA